MRFKIYDPEGHVCGIVEAESEKAALVAYAIDAGYQADDLQREEACIKRRDQIDVAKARFADANGLAGASNSAVTKAWARAGKPL